VAGAAALVGIAVIVYLKRSQLWLQTLGAHLHTAQYRLTYTCVSTTSETQRAVYRIPYTYMEIHSSHTTTQGVFFFSPPPPVSSKYNRRKIWGCK
jgi:hypothetical protein